MFTKEDIINHIKTIKTSVENDIGTAVSAYDEHNMNVIESKQGNLIGFFAVLRMLFPEIDCLGTYLSGNRHNPTQNAILFLKKIFQPCQYRLHKIFRLSLFNLSSWFNASART